METYEGLNKLWTAVEILREYWSEMPIQTAATFIAVAQAEDQQITQQELQQLVGLAQSTLSKNVAYMCEWRRYKEKGLGWLEQFPNPQNRRQRVVRLTKLGKKVAERIDKVFA